MSDSNYASETTDTVPIATKNGEVVVTIQKLNWKVQKKASRLRYEEAIADATRMTAAQMGGAALAEALARAAADRTAKEAAAVGPQPTVTKPAEPTPLTPAQLERLREIRYGHYDQETVLRGGIRSSSDEKEPDRLIADLDEPAADKLHRAILDLTLPPVDPSETENERKND